MKTKIIAGLLLGCMMTGGLTSCHDELNVVQPSQFTSRSMWTEENDANTAVNGMLNRLRSNLADGQLVWGDLRSNLYASGAVNDNFFNRIGTNVLLIGDAGSDWSSLYTTINDANLIIKRAPGIKFITANLENQTMASAYFVRAYCYYIIARTWGNAPLVTSGYESEGQDDMYPFREPVANIYAQIESDIQQASNLIPAGKNLHKISKAAVNMLKADFYLWKAARLGGGAEAYKTAAAAADAVIADNYSLVSNFADMFTVKNENNSEFIFSLPFNVGENVTPGSSPNYFSYFLAPGSDAARLMNAGYGPEKVPAGSHAQYVVPSDDYIDFLLDDPEDSRGAASVLKFTDDFVANTVLVKKMIIKFQGSWTNNTRVFENDMPVYRLAEAYLLKAEALLGQNDLNGAMAAINVIAKRARGVDNYYTGLDKNGVLNALLDESKMEFCAEGKMWWLYLRTNTEFSHISSLVGRQGETNVTLWPVANSCITSNPNIEQTPGW